MYTNETTASFGRFLMPYGQEKDQASSAAPRACTGLMYQHDDPNNTYM